MKSAMFAVGLAVCLTMPAGAQDTHAGHTMPAATPPPPVAAATTAAFTLDTPVEKLMADARAKAVVDAVLPGVTAHPSYDTFKAMSFNQIAPMAPGQLTPEVMTKLKAGLEAIR